MNKTAAVLLLVSAGVLFPRTALAIGPLLRISEREINFGRVDQFQQVRQKIIVRNEGDAPLVIMKIDTDCGCTAAVMADSVIAPGREAPVEIAFSTGDRQGEQHKTVTIKTNDPAEPTVRINVISDVVPYVRLSDERVRFAPVHAGEVKTERVRLAADSGFGLKVKSVEPGEPFFTTKAEPDPSADEEAFFVSMTLLPDAPAGPFRKTIDVETTGRVPRTFHLIVTGQILSYFIVKGEPRVILPVVPAGKPSMGSVMIECDGTKEYRLLSVDVSVPFLKGEIVEKKQNAYAVQVSLAPDAPVGAFRGTVIVHTGDPKQPQIEMMVQGMVRG